MNKIQKLLFLGLVTLAGVQNAHAYDAVQQKTWKAYWISMPDENLSQYGVYEFQKQLKLESVPAEYNVQVSADNRYKLYVNDQLVSVGPSLGDLQHWFYYTINLAPYLKSGANTVRAIVWNDGNQKAVHQFSASTAFILNGTDKVSQKLNTNPSWKVRRLDAYHQLSQHVVGYYALAPGEFIDYNKAASAWRPALGIGPGMPKGSSSVLVSQWDLVPSITPQLDVHAEPIGEKAWTSVTIPANTRKSFLLDNKVLTNAYFNMLMKGGKGATVVVRYAEGLYDNLGAKNNRNETAGKHFIARNDSLILSKDASADAWQEFTTLDWRTYRYVGIDVQTGDSPLTIQNVKSETTRYPFQKESTAKCSDATMEKILAVGWRTIQLCAMETYTDCPYYEQLQYAGDTRIQAMVTYYNTADDRMPRKAIRMIDASRNTEGLTQSRYPSNLTHLIPPFSLHWIGMVYDYHRYRNNDEFVKQQLNGIRQVLHFFGLYEDETHLTKNLPYWQFIDWAENCGRNWKHGAPVQDKAGHNALVDMQLLSAYQMAAELEAGLGEPFYAQRYQSKAEALAKAIRQNYFDAGRGLFADNGDKKFYSQQCNALAILTGVTKGDEAKAIAAKIMDKNENLIEASISFLYYVNQALRISGYGDAYIPGLDIWRKNLALGMTTWGEDSKVETTRSDCHAWGASPNVEYYRTVLGIDSDAPGFQTIRIEPHLGTLTQASGSMPHPNGLVTAAYQKKGKKWQVSIEIPSGTKAYLIWKGQQKDLKEGQNKFVF